MNEIWLLVSSKRQKRSKVRTANHASVVPEANLESLFDIGRYLKRSADIDILLNTAEDRNWDPGDPNVMDFSRPFDVTRRSVMPEEWFPELRSGIASDLNEDQRILLGNEIIRWFLSGILHGEQVALYICAQLCTRLEDPAAQEFMANQAREEARHARAFTIYLVRRWGSPYAPSDAFGRLLHRLYKSARIDQKIVGMSVLIEGFAMGALSNIRAHTHDPALANVLGFILRDEAVHHNFGAFWLAEESGQYTQQDWRDLQSFTLQGYQALRLNLVSIYQRREVYGRFGLDWREVRDAVQDIRGFHDRAPGLEEDINPLAVLAKNLDRANLISAKNRSRFGSWLGPVHGAEA